MVGTAPLARQNEGTLPGIGGHHDTAPAYPQSQARDFQD
jgi:hypothetical protein